MKSIIFRTSALIFLSAFVITCSEETFKNELPRVTALASVLSGKVPLVVSFDGSGAVPDRTIINYEWDFEGDGVFDFNSAVTATTSFTYVTPGTFHPTLRITDNQGGSYTETRVITALKFVYKYPEFTDLNLFTGGSWSYKWVYDDNVNGTQLMQRSGFTTIVLGEPSVVNLPGIGDLIVYKLDYKVSGDIYPLKWTFWQYLGVKDGVIYFATNHNGQWEATTLFDAQTGQFNGESGFMGNFSNQSEVVVTPAFISNEFSPAYRLTGLRVSEPFYKPQCEMISGYHTCDDEFHDYQLQEYYLNGIGFSGFRRTGTSIYSAGNHVFTHKSTMKVWLVGTNLAK